MENEITGIILDSQERGKSSRYIKGISSNGLFSVLAFQSSLPGSLWTDLTQPLHKVRYLVSETTHGFKLKEGVVEERFQGLRSSYQHIESAQFMRAVALKLILPGLACEDFFATFYAHLCALNKPQYEPIHPKAILASFLVKTLVHEGLFNPSLFACCSVCDKRQFPMHLAEGAHFYCLLHLPKNKSYVVDESLGMVLRYLAENRKISSLADFKNIEICPMLLDIIHSL